LEQANVLAKKCKNCGIDTTEMDAIIADLAAKQAALKSNFFAPLGDGTELPP